jgi:hypothetical protein
MGLGETPMRDCQVDMLDMNVRFGPAQSGTRARCSRQRYRPLHSLVGSMPEQVSPTI